MSRSSQITSSPKIKFDTEDFKVFLNCLSNVSDTAVLNITPDNIWAIVSSEDRSLFLLATLDGEFDVETVLNLPSLKKLSKILDMISKKTVEFVIHSNNLEYSDKSMRVKYHLYDDGILNVPKVSKNKIESLTFDYNFVVEKSFLVKLLKNSSVFKDTNKLYVFTEGGNLVWSLGDKTMTNTDVFSICGESVDFEMDEFIMNLDNIRLLSLGNCNEFEFQVNKIGAGSITLTHGNVNLNYILSSLTQ